VKTETKQIAQIAVPVSLEFVVILMLNFVTQIIVGGLGALPIAAVGFANSLTFILMVTVSALGTSVGILSARAFGGGRMHELNQTVSIAIVFAATLTFLTSMVLFLFPYQALVLTGASEAVAATGVDYLRFASLSLLGNVIAAVLSGVFRSVGRPKLPLYATFWTLLLNAILSYALVYGIWLPEMGVAGAGLATVFAATLKALILGYQLFVVYNVTNFELPKSIRYWIEVIRPLFVLAIPLGLTELVWTVGQFAYGVIVQQISDESLAAYNVANGLEGIFIVGSLGLAVAATVLVGRAVGGGDVKTVNRWIQLIKQTGIYSGLFFGAMFALSAFAVPIGFQNAGSDVQRVAISLIFAQSLVQVIKVRNMILGGGILTSGSDIRGVIYGDAVGALVVGIPLAFALGLYTPLGIWGIVIGRAADEIVKLRIFEYRARRINWQKLIDSQSVESRAAE
jgi:putative MATE family efflux protein